MATINIPQRYRPGAKFIVSMSDTSYTELVEALRSAPVSNDHRMLAEAVGQKTRSIEKDRLLEVLDTLTSLYQLRVRSGEDIESVAKNVSEALTALNEEGNKAEGIEQELTARLETLLSLKALNVSALRAKQAQMDFERLLLSVDMTTDLRPVFDELSDVTPRCMVITHAVKLILMDKGSGLNQTKELTFSLDVDDIKKFLSTLERAQKQEQHLRALMSDKSISIVDVS